MTHGKSAKTTENSLTKNPEQGLTESPEQAEKTLEEQLAGLVARIKVLEEKVERLDGVVPNYFDTGVAEPVPKKPGPAKDIEDAELLWYRDGLVGWLEEVWPNIVSQLLATESPLEIATIMRNAAKPENIQPPWQSRFLAHPADLFNFLKSRKFNRKPPTKTIRDALNADPNHEGRRKRAANRLPTRQIANAMAGVPEISWSTSRERCSQNPCSYPVAIATQRHYGTKSPIP